MKYTHAFLALLAAVLLIACRKDDDKPKPEVQPFKIEQVIDYGEYYFECDTCEQGMIRFSITDPAIEEAEWKIGRDPRTFTKRSFSLDFDDPLANVAINLLVKKRNGVAVSDTITKMMQVIRWEDAAYWGKYRGYETGNPDNVFEIELIAHDSVPKFYPQLGCANCYLMSRVYNLPQGCLEENVKIFTPRVLGAYKRFAVISNDGFDDYCQLIEGTGYIKENGEIIIDYSLMDKNRNYERVPKRFIGKRI